MRLTLLVSTIATSDGAIFCNLAPVTSEDSRVTLRGAQLDGRGRRLLRFYSEGDEVVLLLISSDLTYF